MATAPARMGGASVMANRRAAPSKSGVFERAAFMRMAQQPIRSASTASASQIDSHSWGVSAREASQAAISAVIPYAPPTPGTRLRT